jgi:hypothetical protein
MGYAKRRETAETAGTEADGDGMAKTLQAK